MRQLRFVTRTDGGGLVVESHDGLDRYLLTVDDSLRAAVAGASPGLAPQPSPAAAPAPAVVGPRPAPAPAWSAAADPEPDAVSPREIQTRVRAGESPQAVADEHGLSLERVMRFAGPVMAERIRITEEARRARARRTGRDDSEPRTVQFGEAVEERFAAHGIDVEAIAWDSRRREDGEWIVVATWLGGEGSHDAQWLFHRGSRSVTPLDDTAADLLSDRPIRPMTPPAPEADAAPRLMPGVIAFPPFPDAHTGPIRKIEEVFDQEAAPEGPRAVPPLVPAAATADLDFDEPPLPLAITDAEGRPASAGAGALRSVAPRREESEDDKASRARIPSWDDILLGVRRKQD